MDQSADDTYIPPELPDFLKQYTKDAIQSQPKDLLEWSEKYFKALVKGQPVPVPKQSDQQNPQPSRELTPEILSSIHSKFSKRRTVSQQEIVQTWKTMRLEDDSLVHAFTEGRFGEEVEWIKFFSLCCYYLRRTIRNALTQACYIIHSDPKCKPPDACVPFETFRFLYTYLAALSGKIPQAQIDQTLSYLQERANLCNGVVKVSDFINNRKLILDPTA